MNRPGFIGALLALFVPVATAFASEAGFGYEQLRLLINEKNLTSITAVVEHLPPEYKENYTLVYQSDSLHGASEQQPRVLLFGKDAHFIMTFNGDPAQRRYHHLELLQFRPALHEFELHSIVFENGEPQFSDKNPALCLKCHGPSPRPLWGSYNYDNKTSTIHWPGLYGSRHDSPLLNPDERKAFERFRAEQPRHPRFQHLKIDHPDTDWFPYGKGAFEHRFRPNNRLGNLLARLNAQRIASRIIRSDYYKTRPAATLLPLLGCQQLERADFKRAVSQQFEQEFPIDNYSDVHHDLQQTLPTHRMMFMMEKLLTGTDIYTWSLSQRGLADGQRYNTGIRSIDRLIAARVLPLVANVLPWFEPYYQRENNHYLYNSFQAGYYERNIDPGGVGAVYNQLGTYYNEQRAAAACPRLYQQAMRELSSEADHG